MPENMSMSFTVDTQQAHERMLKEANERFQAYQVCGTPHIEIYAPGGEVIAKDVCADKQGTQFLRAWMRSPSGG